LQHAAGGRVAKDIQDRIHQAERRLSEIQVELANVNRDILNETEVVAALADFDGIYKGRNRTVASGIASMRDLK
jgi:hypothetical protein